MRVPAAAGRLSRLGLHAGADEASRAASSSTAFYEYMNWYTSGFPGRVHRPAGLLLVGPGKRQEVPHRGGVGLLVRRQAGRDRHHRPLRQADGEGRQHARRRRLLGPHGQYRRVEFGDGRRPLPDAALERVHHVMTIVPATLDRRAAAARPLHAAGMAAAAMDARPGCRSARSPSC